jgi:hypothetical protein
MGAFSVCQSSQGVQKLMLSSLVPLLGMLQQQQYQSTGAASSNIYLAAMAPARCAVLAGLFAAVTLTPVMPLLRLCSAAAAAAAWHSGQLHWQ